MARSARSCFFARGPAGQQCGGRVVVCAPALLGQAAEALLGVRLPPTECELGEPRALDRTPRSGLTSRSVTREQGTAGHCRSAEPVRNLR